MVVGSPGIVAEPDMTSSICACQKLNLRKIHNYCKHRSFHCRFYVSQKVDIA